MKDKLTCRYCGASNARDRVWAVEAAWDWNADGELIRDISTEKLDFNCWQCENHNIVFKKKKFV